MRIRIQASPNHKCIFFLIKSGSCSGGRNGSSSSGSSRSNNFAGCSIYFYSFTVFNFTFDLGGVGWGGK